MTTTETSAPGWLLGGRYRVLDRVGTGGMADVFRAEDEVLRRQVAVKVFRMPAAEVSSDQERERQQAEVHALAALNHPNLITMFDGSLNHQPAFLVLELINGPSLAEELSRGPLPGRRVRSIGLQIADALAYVHAHQMVHRDVKPANILLGTDATHDDDTWRARLSDFGIVRIMGAARMTNANFTIGSASYLAPEQARGDDVGGAADVYSLGLVLIEALTGQRCYNGTAIEALTARLARSPQLPPHLPRSWSELLSAMTVMDPAARPTAAYVARTLREWATPDSAFAVAADPEATTALPALPPPVVPPVDPPEATSEQWLGHGRHFGLLAAALIAIVIAGVVMLMNDSFPGVGSEHPATAGTNLTQTQTPTTGIGGPVRVARNGTSASVVAPVVNTRSRASKPAVAKATTSNPTVLHSGTSATSAPPTSSAPPSTTPSSSPTPSSSTTPTASTSPTNAVVSTPARKESIR